jgi:hypothetical protein
VEELVHRDGQADAGVGAGGRPLSRRERRRMSWQGQSCSNCSTPLQGPYCHLCGQPERTPMRELTTLTNDALDYMLDVDARVWKTLRDLIFRPGRLTVAYLAGQRMSFVRPLRLYLVASALLFLVVGMSTDVPIQIGGVTDQPEAVESQAAADAGARLAAATAAMAAATTPEERAQRQREMEQAARELQQAADAAGSEGGESREPKAERDPITFNFNDEQWHRTDNPLLFAPLPVWANDAINDYIEIIRHNLELVRSDPKRLGAAFLRVLPQSLFVLLPIFALLLKLVFLLKRRLYLEHLMVALHSHTFIYFAIVLALTLQWIDGGWPHGWVNPFGFLFALTVAWIPINLLLTQKRVYRQGWFGAIVAYSVIGVMYTVLFTVVAIGALVASLVSL